MQQIRIWWQAFRYHFVSPSFLPVILGSVLAWALTGKFYPFYFVLTVLGVTINHISLNMTDDYFDYKHSVDRARGREKNPYSSGSGTLTSGLIKPSVMYRVFMGGYLITILLGLLLSAARGWTIFLIGAFGLGSAYFYTAPPIRYGYHGFGEISQLINFSLTIGLGAYFVQAQNFSLEVLVAVLPLGFMMFSMITINEIPDEKQDREGGKKTLVVIFGGRTGVWLYAAGMFVSFLIIILGPIFQVTSYWSYLSLVTLPWFFKAVSVALKNFHDPAAMSPANMLTIKIHNLTGILLIVAYVIQGAMDHREIYHMWLPLAALFILYLPIALTIFVNVIPIKSAETNKI